MMVPDGLFIQRLAPRRKVLLAVVEAWRWMPPSASRHANRRMTNASHVRSSADPEEVSAQIDLIGVPRPLIGFETSAAQIGGSRAQAADHQVTQRDAHFKHAGTPGPCRLRVAEGCADTNCRRRADHRVMARYGINAHARRVFWEVCRSTLCRRDARGQTR
jgi:hypothetical protein